MHRNITTLVRGALGLATLVMCSLALSLALGTQVAQADLIKYEGGVAAQTAWRDAVGSFVSESFESYPIDARISSFPALGLTFDPLPDGGPPGIYLHSVDNVPDFGPKQLANFPGNCCITGLYQFGDLTAQVNAGVNLVGLAFWNGDPQGDSVLRVFDQSGALLGTVTALINTGTATSPSNSFAGFISSVPVGRLEWEGNAGDGWNHYDGLQVTFATQPSVPEPSSLMIVFAGLAGLWFAARRWNRLAP